MVQTLWKTVWRFLKKLKIELPDDPATPLLGIHPKEMISLSVLPHSLQHYSSGHGMKATCVSTDR